MFHCTSGRFDKALALDPNLPEVQWNKSCLCLLFGRFEEGWRLYGSRWSAGTKGKFERKYPQPRWNGERLDGTLMIWGEQGLGDQILYAGMLPEVVGRADHIIVEVEPRLVPPLLEMDVLKAERQGATAVLGIAIAVPRPHHRMPALILVDGTVPLIAHETHTGPARRVPAQHGAYTLPGVVLEGHVAAR